MATKDYKYPKDTPVDEPVVKKAKPTPKPAPKPVVYPKDVPVDEPTGMKRGGKVKKMANGGSASSRADGIAQRGKTRGTMLCGGGMAKGKK